MNPTHVPTMRFVAVSRVAVLFCLLAVGGLAGSARAEIPMDFVSDTLAKFDFEGVTLATTPDELKKLLPTLESDEQKSEQKIHVDCYLAADLKTADAARFYFVDDKLYQIEIDYQAERIESLGGMNLMLRKLVMMFGFPDHADATRRTWQQPTIGRRADFYANREGARLFLTDTNLTLIVQQRTRRAMPVDPVDYGF